MNSILSKKNIAILCLFCLTVTLLCGAGFAPAEEPETEAVVQESVPLYVDGIRVGDGMLIDGTTYVQLAAFCGAMGRDPETDWDEETETMTVALTLNVELKPENEADAEPETAGADVGPGEPIPAEDERETVQRELQLTAAKGDAYLTANGRCVWAPAGLCMAEGELAAPIRSLAAVFGLEVEWDEETRSVSLDSRAVDVLEDAETFYDAETLYWLSHIIFAESGNQSLEGMIGVGNVVLNRVADPGCPDNVYDVIFDNRYGVQFTPTETGTIYDEPNELSIVAAKLCLEGANVAEDSLFFVNPDIGLGAWFRDTRTYVVTIGDHAFYA